MTKSFHSKTCFNIYVSVEIYMNEKLNLYLSYLVRKFPNQYKEQTANKVPSQSFSIT